jgi:hypothetical protein
MRLLETNRVMKANPMRVEFTLAEAARETRARSVGQY